MKKLRTFFTAKLNIVLFSIFSIVLCQFSLSKVSQAALPPEISAKHAIVIEAMTGRPLYEKNADDKAYPASLTKMLTCIIALETGALERTYTVSPYAAGTEDPYLQLMAGEQLTLRDLILGLMMVSDNSSAVVIAEGLAQTTSEFSDIMNKKAKEIGLLNSNFVTPNGLPSDNHYSTAKDMSLIAAYAWKNSVFRDIVGQKEAIISWHYPYGKTFAVQNSNKLLWRMEGVNGIKTGWTSAAGGCLAASAQRDGVQLIAVVLDSSDVNTRFDDAEKLLEFGFSKVEMVKILDKSRTEKKLFVTGGENFQLTAHPAEDMYFPILEGESKDDYSVKFDIPFSVPAPVKKEQKVGNIIIYYKGQELRQIPLLADNAVSRGYNVVSMLIGVVDNIINFFKK